MEEATRKNLAIGQIIIKKMKRYFCCILLSSIVLQVFGQIELCERLYVQTDKQLYLAGEQIRMKVLTTDTKQIPLVFSKIAYVELVDDSIARIQLMVELTNAAGEGQMQIPADMPTGYYRLIAYTQHMRNEGTEVFFEKNIAVVNTYQSGYQPEEQETATETRFSSELENSSGSVSLQPDKAIYTTRDRGELTVSGLPENIHTLSVSIAGKEWMPVAETNASLFRKNLTKKPDGNAIAAQQREAFLSEYEGHIVTGKIIDNQTGTEAPDNIFLVPALSFPGDGIRFFPGQKTETGDVRFFTSGISGMKEIATVIYHVDDKYRIDIESPFVTHFAPESIPTLRIDSAYYSQLLERSVALQVLHYFSDDPSANRNISEPHFKMKPSISYPLDEYTRFTTMREVFTEFILGARFRRTDGKWGLSTFVKRGDSYIYGTAPLVLLDGVPISVHDNVFNYDPLTVETINIYYGPCNIGGCLFDGIVELITYRRFHQDLNLDKSSQVISYNGPQLYNPLVTPDYSDEKNRQSRMPDSRHTLLWNPDVSAEGKTSIRLPFDTSDLTGDFQATVEGITEDGKFIFETSFFKVAGHAALIDKDGIREKDTLPRGYVADFKIAERNQNAIDPANVKWAAPQISRFRWSFAPGYAYRLGKDVESSGYAQFDRLYKKIRNCFSWETEIQYYFNHGHGIALNINGVHSSASAHNVYVPEYGQASQCKLKQQIIFIGPAWATRYETDKFLFSGCISLGSLFYAETLMPDNFSAKMTAVSFGMNYGIGGEYKLSPDLALGLKIGYTIGTTSNFKIGGQTIKTEDPLSLSSFFIAAYFSFRK